MLLPKSSHFIALFFSSAAFIHPKTFNFEAWEWTRTLVKEIYFEEKFVLEKVFSHFSAPRGGGEAVKKSHTCERLVGAWFRMKTKTSKAFKNARVKKQFASKVTPKCSLRNTINHNLRFEITTLKATDGVDAYYINFIFRKLSPYTFRLLRC